jgi:hypothetical protein
MVPLLWSSNKARQEMNEDTDRQNEAIETNKKPLFTMRASRDFDKNYLRNESRSTTLEN